MSSGFQISLKIWVIDGETTIVVLEEFHRNQRKLFSARTFRQGVSGYSFMSSGFRISPKIWVMDGDTPIVVLGEFRRIR